MTTATTTAPVTAPKPTKTTKAGPDTSTSVRPLDPRLLRYARVSLVAAHLGRAARAAGRTLGHA